MNKTSSGLADDARTFIGDDFCRLEFTCRETIDLGAMIGASPAPNDRYCNLRNQLITDLLLAAWANPERWIAYSRDRNCYAALRYYFGSSVSFPAMIWAVTTLEAAGLVLHRKTRPSARARYRSTLRATSEFVRSIPITNVDQLRRIICQPIRLKDSLGTLCRYKESRQTRDWRADVNEQNEALLGLTLSFESPDWKVDGHGLLHNDKRVINQTRNQLYRVFNGSFTLGGRWYGPWWQGLPARDRNLLRIDHQPVVEIDYQYLHPTLLAAMAGRDIGDNDPYLVPGFERREAKVAFNILVNARSEQSAVLALKQKLVEFDCEEPLQHASNLVSAVKMHHPEFSFAWGAGIGLRLQGIDADMCAIVQQRMRHSGYPVLSVHDSFIVAAPQKDILRSVMDETLDRTKYSIATGS